MDKIVLTKDILFFADAANVVPTALNTPTRKQRTREPGAKPKKNDKLILTDTHLTLMVVGIVLVLSISAGSFIIVCG